LKSFIAATVATRLQTPVPMKSTWVPLTMQTDSEVETTEKTLPSPKVESVGVKFPPFWAETGMLVI
jgi:hypothetical protein